ncbi:unnamed protein product [Schistocephalus solidus]|uniref:GIY-YIG domain-containing protein n=1 Tax=Schistocephalus solidus TaxID=70667 RepID=A0A3P7E1C6_SCHSO|nr:unnamed protein product [Schistocephalus solidus]
MKVWRAMPHIENVSEAVACLLQPLGIGVAHKPEATLGRLVMRPKAPLPRGEMANVVYRVQCGSCEANYVGETGKRLQTRMSQHARAVRRMDQLSLVAEHCVASGHIFSLQNAEILGQVSTQQPEKRSKPGTTYLLLLTVLLVASNIKHLYCMGGALKRNPILLQQLEKEYKSLECLPNTESIEACVGVALFTGSILTAQNLAK